jgi:3-methyl-2-oxobutanoate hydroxymethyltransferase
MSVISQVKRITARDILARKGGEPLACLTAYDAMMASLMDEHIDLILVGDSVGMVVHGHSTTIPVTLEMMILHAQAVMRGTSRAMVVVDLPFGVYEASKEQAFSAAARVMKETGASAVKLEGGAVMAETISFLVSCGIPVMAHVGMTPQAINVLGSFRARGREAADRAKIMSDAKAVAEAGAFSVVLEAIPEPLAVEITAAISIPTIGIGASAACDGQILVINDLLGLTPKTPRFAKRYLELGEAVRSAISLYSQEVRGRAFPAAEHVYAEKKTPV